MPRPWRFKGRPSAIWSGARELSSRSWGVANARLCPRSIARCLLQGARRTSLPAPLAACRSSSRGGIPLWVFPRGDLPTVTGAIVMPGGAGVQRPGQAGLAQLTVAMLDEGTLTRTAEQIALEAESMGATVDATCGWAGAYVSFKCLKTDLRASLDLAADILRNPTFPEAEWDRVRGQALAALKAERDHAESRAPAGTAGGHLSGRAPVSIPPGRHRSSRSPSSIDRLWRIFTRRF